jgi:hypothetical protein
LCTVVVGLLPVILRALADLSSSHPIRWALLLSEGDLQILSAAICGATIYELTQRDVSKDHQGARNSVLVLSVVIAMIAAGWFGSLTGEHSPELGASDMREWRIAVGSGCLLLCASAVGLRTIFLPTPRGEE